jgi:hypothetical protein
MANHWAVEPSIRSASVIETLLRWVSDSDHFIEALAAPAPPTWCIRARGKATYTGGSRDRRLAPRAT